MMRVFQNEALTALLNVLKGTKETSDANAVGVSGLQGDLVELSQSLSRDLGGLVDAVNGKQEMGVPIPFTIPVTGWQEIEIETAAESDDEEDILYRFYHDFALVNTSINDRVEIFLSPESQVEAKACGLCATNQSGNGYFRIWSESVPENPMMGECWIIDGKEI